MSGSDPSKPVLYMIAARCSLCDEVTRFVEARANPVQVTQEVWLSVDICPECGNFLPGEGGEWDIQEEAQIERKHPVGEGDDGLRADGSGGTKYGEMLEGHEWDSPEDEGTGWRERTTGVADLEVTLHDGGYQTDRRWTVHVRRGHRDHPVAVYAAEHQNKGNFWRVPDLWQDAVDFVELPLAVRKRVASMLNRPVDEITPEIRMVHREDGTGIGDRAGESSGTCEVCGGTLYDDESDTHEACEGVR